MSRAGLDALLAEAETLSADRYWVGVPAIREYLRRASTTLRGLAAAVRDLRDDRDRALERLGAAVQLPSLRMETRGRMIWDSLHVVECRGAPGTLPPEWDVRDETGCAYATSCPTREDAERVAAALRAVLARLT